MASHIICFTKINVLNLTWSTAGFGRRFHVENVPINDKLNFHCKFFIFMIMCKNMKLASKCSGAKTSFGPLQPSCKLIYISVGWFSSWNTQHYISFFDWQSYTYYVWQFMHMLSHVMGYDSVSVTYMDIYKYVIYNVLLCHIFWNS